MYTIYADDELIYHPNIPEYSITEGKLKLELNTSGSLSFTIPDTNPSYGRIQLMKSMITLYEDNQLIFRGRAYAPSVDLFRQDTIECEGDFAFFNDTYQEPFNYEVGDVKTLLQAVINKHNAQVPVEKQFKLGTVTVKNNTVDGNIVRSSQYYQSTMKVLKEKFLNMLGGYFWVRRTKTAIFLDYLEDMNYTINQGVEQTVNLLDAKREVNTDELATVIIPIGAKLKNENGEETGEYLTLLDSTGSLSVQDEEGIETYGVITKVVQHDNITLPENLLKAGKEDLAKALGVVTKLTLTAADLSKTGQSVKPFMIGNYINVTVPNLDIDSKMLIRSLDIDLLHPESSTLTIGMEEKSFTAKQFHTQETIERVNRNLQGQIQEQRNSAVVRAVREASSNMNQTAEEIRSEVSEAYYNKEDADALLESIKTIITQTADTIEFSFKQFKQDQNTFNTQQSNKFAEMNKYIRFDNGDIVLGEEGSPITLRIENDRINFKEWGVDSAYWENGKFYAVDGEFINSLKLGKFAFIPRETGNLSFTKVVD